MSQREGLTPAYSIDKNRSDPNNPDEYDDLKWTVTWNRNANGYRLPTEAEWEYACRAGTTTPYYTGNSITTSQANFGRSSYTTVGSYAPNPWGLYDMQGNVSEWCWDWFGPYSSGAQIDPVGPSSNVYSHAALRTVRGGSTFHSEKFVGRLRSAYRTAWRPTQDIDGFRVARNAE